MKSILIGMLAETSIHPGSGQDTGFVDLPVAREAATDYPVIVGSSMKGALLDYARSQNLENINNIFGQQDSAGQLLVGDARLLLLPVRSLQGTFKWVTCPHLLQRFQRDKARASNKVIELETIQVARGQYFGQTHGDTLYLEEREFTHHSMIDKKIIDQITQLMTAAESLQGRLVIINDDDFAWFARYGLAINARNVLDPVKKTSVNLWYEETIPPDALFYNLLSERNSGVLNEITDLFERRPYLQVGGNETVGQGWFAIKPFHE